MSSLHLSSIRKRFEIYKELGDKTFPQLTDEQIFWKYNPETNSIAVIVKHLWGNMLSRWRDFLTSDGEKEWRQRDAEFENDLSNREELLAKWEEGWSCLFKELDQITEADLTKEILIRNEPHSVLDAINRQLSHSAYHVGQIVFVGKMLSGANWTSISIPKGKSTDYIAEKFEVPTK